MRPAITPRWLQQIVPLRDEQTEVLAMGIFGFIAIYAHFSEPTRLFHPPVLLVVFASIMTITIGLLWAFEVVDRSMINGVTWLDTLYDVTMLIIVLSLPVMAFFTV